MITADAYLWAKYIDDTAFRQILKRLHKTALIITVVIMEPQAIIVSLKIPLFSRMLRLVRTVILRVPIS